MTAIMMMAVFCAKLFRLVCRWKIFREIERETEQKKIGEMKLNVRPITLCRWLKRNAMDGAMSISFRKWSNVETSSHDGNGHECERERERNRKKQRRDSIMLFDAKELSASPDTHTHSRLHPRFAQRANKKHKSTKRKERIKENEVMQSACNGVRVCHSVSVCASARVSMCVSAEWAERNCN